MPEEPGNFGLGLVSLAGVPGSPGRGRVELDHSTALSTTSKSVLGANVKRITAEFENAGSVNIWLQKGAAAVANTGKLLLPGGYYLINHDDPWVGDVHALSASGTPTLLITETTVP